LVAVGLEQVDAAQHGWLLHTVGKHGCDQVSDAPVEGVGTASPPLGGRLVEHHLWPVRQDAGELRLDLLSPD
jgi:hypothetical protein